MDTRAVTYIVKPRAAFAKVTTYDIGCATNLMNSGSIVHKIEARQLSLSRIVPKLRNKHPRR